jgi:Tol biopolymer transport system component
MLRFTLLLCLLATCGAQEVTEATLLSNARQLIFEGKRSGEGYFSPDGKKLVFQSEREGDNPFYQIYTLDLESGDIARVSSGLGKTTCAFFQPGKDRLLYASTQNDPQVKEKMQAEIDFRASGKQRRYAWDYDETMDIFSVGLDGKELKQLTNARGYDAEAAFSPTGDEIVFCSTRSGYEQLEATPENKARLEKDPAYYGEIYLMNADGTEVKRLTNTPGYDGGPFFSPSGSRICWRRFDESGMNADIYTMNRIGGTVMRLTDFGCMAWAPYYHPSDTYLIFTANKLGFENFELFIVDTQGEKEPVRVTHTNGFDGLPVFSPDGRKLCWTTNRTADGKSQLFLADWNHNAALQALRDAPLRKSKPVEQPKTTEAVPQKEVNSPLPSIGSVSLKPEIAEDDLRLEVGHLANAKHDGRATGSEGARLASDWLGEYYKTAGLQPLPGQKSYFHEFEFNAGEKILADQNQLSLTAGAKSGAPAWKVDKDFRPLAFTENGEVEGDVVFAGYGLSVPEGPGQMRYNSFEGLDVKDKVVLLLRYVPEQVEAPRRAHLNRYAGLRYKVMMARERGAKAVLVVTGPNSPNAGELMSLSGDGSNSGSGIAAASITAAVAEEILKASGKTLKDLQTGLDTENPHAPGGFVIPNVRVKLRTGVEHIHKMDRNVVGYIPADPASPTAGEWVVLGAHYDHLGRGSAGGGSLARSGEQAKIHYGADDNASGTALVLEIAAALAKDRAQNPAKFSRNIVFALWSGEEMGLLGSNAFCEKPPIDLAKTVAYVNADMVGRLRDNKLLVQAVGSSKAWPRLLEKRNVAAGFALTLQEDPYLPTDVTSFYPKRIPVLNFFTGSHEDYHRPTDTADKVDVAGLARISTFVKNIVADVAQAPERIEFSRVERKDQGGSRDNLRAYLGSIPDYATELKGVKLSGVRAGSPAEKAGLKGGDVIVEFAGQKIANIYDYTYALDAVKIGKPVKIAVERAGARVELTAMPEARK